MHSQLARPRPHHVAAHADVVAQVQQLVQRKRVLAHIVLAHVDLHPLAALLQLREPGLALHPDRHNPPGDRHLDLLARLHLGRKLLRRNRVVAGAQLRPRVCVAS